MSPRRTPSYQAAETYSDTLNYWFFVFFGSSKSYARSEIDFGAGLMLLHLLHTDFPRGFPAFRRDEPPN